MAGEKVGRNAPCPCGSGRKYKHCCLGQATPSSGQMEATKEALQAALAEKDFDSIEDVQAELDRFMAGFNAAPIPEFHGLSSDQVHRFLYFPFDTPELVTFSDPLPVEPEAPIVTLFSALVEGIGESGVKTTAKGNLPRNLVRQAAMAYLGEEGYREHTRLFGISREDDFYAVHATRLVAQLAGLMRKYRGRFVLTRKCRDTLERTGTAGIYPQLFRSFAEKFNWGYGDGYPELPFIQQSFLFSLYLLNLYGDEERPLSFYEQNYLDAFPALLEEVEPRPYAPVEKTAARCYSLRTFERFAKFFGLASIKKRGLFYDTHPEESETRKTPLLEQVVHFASGTETR